MRGENVLWGVVLSAVAWFVAAPGRAAEVEIRDCTAYRLTGSVTIDGKLDEQAWTDLPEYTGFRWNNAPETYAAYQSSFRVGYDDQALYVGIRAEEPRMKEHLENGLKKMPGKLSWKHQLFEIFLSPETPDGTQYYQFAVDVYGYTGAFKANLEGKPYEFKKTQWEAAEVDFDAAVHTASDHYTMEIRFPFDGLGAKAKAGKAWRLHIGRHGTWAPPDSGLHWKITSWSAWNGGIGHWRNMPRHGRLLFAPEPLMPGIAQKLTRQINADFRAWQNTDRTLDAQIAKTKGKPNLLEAIDGNKLLLNGERNGLGKLTQNRSLSMPQVYLLEWDEPLEFNCNLIEWTNPSVFAEIYGLEYWDGTSWKLAYKETEHFGPRSCHIFAPVEASKVRLTISKHTPNRWYWMKIKEFGLFKIERDAKAAAEKEG